MSSLGCSPGNQSDTTCICCTHTWHRSQTVWLSASCPSLSWLAAESTSGCGGGNSVCLYDLNPHCCYSALIILPQQNIQKKITYQYLMKLLVISGYIISCEICNYIMYPFITTSLHIPLARLYQMTISPL